MTLRQPTSYQDIQLWREYERRLPPEYRFSHENPKEEVFEWRGLPVHLDRLPAPEAPLKLLLLHGIGGYGRIILGFGAPFRPEFCEVVSPDLPGYGLTPAPAGRLTFGDWTACTQSLVDSEIARDGRPVIAFGLSLGGMVAYHAACVAPVRGLIATAFVDMTDPEVAAGVSRFTRLSRMSLPLLKVLPDFMTRIRLPSRLLAKMDGISNDASLSQIIGRDPYGGGNALPLSFLQSIIATPPAIAPESFTRCPTLLVHPGQDRMTDIRFSQRFFDRLATRKSMHVLENAGHWPVEEPGATQMRKGVQAFLSEILSG